VAACLLCDACPPEDSSRDFAKVGVEWDPWIEPGEEATDVFFSGKRKDIEDLERVIMANNPGQTNVNPRDIALWAHERKYINLFHPIARRLLTATNPTASEDLTNALARIVELEGKLRLIKGTLAPENQGSHWEIRRSVILGAALNELTSDRRPFIDNDGKIVASKLAARIDDMWFKYGSSDVPQPTYNTIYEAIRNSIKTKI